MGVMLDALKQISTHASLPDGASAPPLPPRNVAKTPVQQFAFPALPRRGESKPFTPSLGPRVAIPAALGHEVASLQSILDAISLVIDADTNVVTSCDSGICESQIPKWQKIEEPTPPVMPQEIDYLFSAAELESPPQEIPIRAIETLSEPPADEVKIVWPDHDDVETDWACVKAAETIFRQWSLVRPTVVGFTSPGDGDGKTRFLLHVAPHLAKQLSDDVLVVDADGSWSALTSQLHRPTDTLETISETIRPTQWPRLHVLPAENSCGDSIGVSRGGFPESYLARIEELRKTWPLILVDLASLTHPEASQFITHCDGVYLVVRLGHTSRRATAEAVRVIRHADGRLLGCAVVG
jgi:Mrp family chromosome partitioning ATPase